MSEPSSGRRTLSFLFGSDSARISHQARGNHHNIMLAAVLFEGCRSLGRTEIELGALGMEVQRSTKVEIKDKADSALKD